MHSAYRYTWRWKRAFEFVVGWLCQAHKDIIDKHILIGQQQTKTIWINGSSLKRSLSPRAEHAPEKKIPISSSSLSSTIHTINNYHMDSKNKQSRAVIITFE
jgi:hypothetical protein